MKRVDVTGYKACLSAVRAKNDGHWRDFESDVVWHMHAPDGSGDGFLVCVDRVSGLWEAWYGTRLMREDEPRRFRGWIECSQDEAHLGGGLYLVATDECIQIDDRHPSSSEALTSELVDAGWFYCRREGDKQ